MAKRDEVWFQNPRVRLIRLRTQLLPMPHCAFPKGLGYLHDTRHFIGIPLVVESSWRKGSPWNPLQWRRLRVSTNVSELVESYMKSEGLLTCQPPVC